MKFDQAANKMPGFFDRLKASKPVRSHGEWIVDKVPNKGIYVFYEDGKPLYVGRSNNLRARINGHGASSETQYGATFAFKLLTWIVHAQSQEVTPTAGATGENPPAKPTNLQAAAEHDAVTLTWTASTDQTVTHYAILRRNRDTDALGVFHVIDSNAGPETGYTDGSVAAESRYNYRAKAVSPTGVSQWSGFVQADTPAAPDPTPPPEPQTDPADLAPSNLTAALAEGGGVALSWTAPAEDADSVTGYEILRAVGQGEQATLATDTGSTATAYTDATATEAGETYAYQVKAIRGEERSQGSGQAQVQVPHDPADLAPSGLIATFAEDSGVTLTWTAPAEDAGSVTGYEILRAVGEGELATLVDDTGSTANSYADATATEAGETYTYRVKAIRGEDRSQASGQAQVQLPHDAVDLAPSNLTAEKVDGGINLSWTAPAEDADSVTGYEILRAVGEGEQATLVDDTGSIATAYTDATATDAEETYAYRVKAIRGEERSQASGQAQVQLPHDAVDLAPSNLTAEKVDGGINLSWTAPAEDADSVTGYEILRAVGEGEQATLVDDTGSTATAYTDANATATDAGETYAYQVKAIRGEDRSQASGQAQIQVPHDPADQAPTNLTALIWTTSVVGDDSTTTSVALSWSAPAEDAASVTGYEILRAVGQGELSTLVADTGSTATTYTDATANEAGETYSYQVRAIRGEERSQASGQAQVQIPHDPVDLAPSGLTATVVEGSGVTLSWAAPAEEADPVTGYEVLRAVGAGELSALVADTGSTATTYTDATATEAGETYAYRVKAIRGEVRSQSSDRVAVMTEEPETSVPTGPTAGIELSNNSIEVGEEITVTVRYGGLEPSSYSSRSQPHFRVDVVGADGCEGDGMGSDRHFWIVDEDPEVRTARVGLECPGGEYTAETKLYDAAGDLLSSATAAFTVSDAASAPSNLSVALVEDLVTLSWEAPSEKAEEVTGYEVLRGQGEAEPTTLAEDTGTTATTYGDMSAVEAGASYAYRVRAIRDGERSEPSETVRIELPEDYVPPVSTSTEFGVVVFDPPPEGNSDNPPDLFLPSTKFDPGSVLFGDVVVRADEETPALLVGNTGQTQSTTQELSATFTKLAVTFTTGASAGGYSVSSVGIRFGSIADTSTAASELTATINEDDSDNPGDVLCTLDDPATYAADSVNTYTAPSPGCSLAASTTYYVVLERANNAAGTIEWFETDTTESTAVDSGSAKGWSLFGRYLFAGIWFTLGGKDFMIEVRGAAEAVPDIPATGRPIVLGPPHVGGALAADVSNIEDENGIDSETFTYQWVLLDGGEETETDIDGATSSTYTLKPEDEGKKIKVRVGFTDDAGHSEGPLPSYPTGTVKPVRLIQGLLNNTGQTPIISESVTSSTPKYAQGFTTGTNSPSYSVSSVGISLAEIADTLTVGSELTATINEENGSKPGDVRCTLVDPPSYAANSVNTYTAPSSGCSLAPGATYYVVLERANNNTDSIKWLSTASEAEDSGGAPGWSIADGRYSFSSGFGKWILESGGVLMMEVRGPEPVLNNTVMGRPTVNGIRRVDYTLTADTSAISDANGLPETFTYQWVRVDVGEDTDITGATDQTYTLTNDDEGNKVRVRVEFTDSDGFSEGPLTSAATDVVGAYVLNSSATGKPTVGGTARVGEKLTANTSAISDANGLPDTFSYQWVRVDGTTEMDIDRATGPRYIPGPADESKTIRVRVEFTDDDGFEESLLSDPTDPVTLAGATVAATATLWTATLTVGTKSGDTSTGYSPDHSGTLSPATFEDETNIHAPTSAAFTIITDDQGNKIIKKLGPITTTYTVRAVVLSGGDLTFEVSPILPDTAGTWQLKVGTGFDEELSTTNRTDDAANDISSFAWAGAGLSFTSGETVAIALDVVNSVASGEPTVVGRHEVGERLTADVSGISDANGKPDRALAYSYQWFADGTSLGARATAQHYWPTRDDVGRYLSVLVSYEDEDGLQEGPIFSSEETPVQGSDTVMVPLSGTMEVYYRRVNTLKLFNGSKGQGSMYPTGFEFGDGSYTVSLVGYMSGYPSGLYLDLDRALPGSFELYFAGRPGLDSAGVTPVNDGSKTRYGWEGNNYVPTSPYWYGGRGSRWPSGWRTNWKADRGSGARWRRERRCGRT